MKQTEMRFAPLTDRHRKVLDALSGRKGKTNALSAYDLSRLSGIPSRQARELIRELVEDHGEEIGSCKEGFYRIETDAEARECQRAFLVTARAAVTRAAAFGKTKTLQRIINDLHHLAQETP